MPEIQVILPVECKFGQFANAFRIVEDNGKDCVLDFLVYSASDQTALVVSRVRVRREFLTAVREQLDKVLEDMSGSDMPCWISRN